ncbi:MAG: aminoglycoside phosphotransferase family protein [Propionibacteriaceae bacterium]|nr:aminoglycoside phosphotransferase family protein [Propionibacteriaceae bacterium]
MSAAPTADVTTTPALVRDLLAAQAPSLADLPVTPLGHGWDNDLYRLGEGLLVRLPRREQAAGLVENEARWLPVLGEGLPIETPQPVVVGTPSDAFGYPWLVVAYIAGTPASNIPVPERTVFAEQLADLLWALHAPAPQHAPLNPVRGGSLANPESDARVRQRLADLATTEPDLAAALAPRWDAWSRTPDHDGTDVWLHGDLHPHNLVVGADRLLSGVIDWGDLTAGDPACDLAAAWLTFDADGRARFIAQYEHGLPHDAALWARARAWALHLGLIFATQSDDEPALAAIGRHALEALAAELSA